MTYRPNGGSRVAAFFDIDGTLVPPPSLERRFFAALRRRRAISTKSFLQWLARAVQLAPSGIEAIRYANKMYLRGVAACAPSSKDTLVCARASQDEAFSIGSSTGPPRSFFFPAAINQAAWHASADHAIVLVSGTLAPLAHQAAVTLALKLAALGVSANVGVCATRLEEVDGRWTGRILGNAVFGEAKALAIRHVAITESFDLRRCYAYGNSGGDRWMLDAVGRPAVVNPSRDLERTARLNDWPVLRWKCEAKPKDEATESRSPLYLPVTSQETENQG